MSKEQSVVTVNELLDYYFPEKTRNRPINKMINELVIHHFPKDSSKKVEEIIQHVIEKLLSLLPENVRKSTPRTTLDQFKYNIATEVKKYYYKDYNNKKLDNFPEPTLKDLLLYSINELDDDTLKKTPEQIMNNIVKSNTSLNQTYPEFFKLVMKRIIGNIPKEVLEKTPETLMQKLVDNTSLEVSKQARLNQYNKNTSLGHTNSVKEMKNISNDYKNTMKNEVDIDNMNEYDQKTNYYTQENSNRNDINEVGFQYLEKSKFPKFIKWEDNQPFDELGDVDETQQKEFKESAQIFYDPALNTGIQIGSENHVVPANLRAADGQNMPQVKIFEDPTTKQEYYYLKGYQMFIPINRQNNNTAPTINNSNNNSITENNSVNNVNNKVNDKVNNKVNDKVNNKVNNNGVNKDNIKDEVNNERLNKLKALNDKINNANNNSNSEQEKDSYVVTVLHKYITKEAGKQLAKTIIVIAIIVLCLLFVFLAIKYFGQRPNIPQYGPPTLHSGKSNSMKGGKRRR